MAAKKKKKERVYGKPPNEDFLRQMETLGGLAISIAQSARMFGITPAALFERMRNYPQVREAYERGLAKTNTKVSETAYKLATSGRNSDMTKWWLSIKGGWRDTHHIQIDPESKITVETKNTTIPDEILKDPEAFAAMKLLNKKLNGTNK